MPSACATAALLAVSITPVPVLLRVAMVSGLLVWLLHRWHVLRTVHRVLQYRAADDQWQLCCHIDEASWLSTPIDTLFDGHLVDRGYRSPWLVILAIQSDDTCIHRVAVWHDQLSGAAFSFLHQQLAFAARPPRRRTTRAWLRDLLG